MWKRDERTEAFLTSLGADWDYMENIPMTDLHSKWDQVNTSRDGAAIIEDTAKDYGERMDKGESPPAAICTLEKNGKLMIRDGRQRMWGARNIGWTHFSAYVVNSDNEITLQLVELGANNSINGSAPSNKSYVVSRAVDMHLRHGISFNELSKALRIGEKTIEKEMIRRRVADRLQQLGFSPVDFNKKALEELHTVEDWFERAPNAMKKFCNIIARAKLENGYVSKACKQIAGFKKKNGESQVNTVCRDLEQDQFVARRLRNKGSGKREPIENVEHQLKTLRTSILSAKKKKALASSEEAKRIEALLTDINMHLRWLMPQGAL